ncbi:MAG: ATP-binding cassette domain-containing protein [Thermoleophilia bacterium]|nr:ATP-binding cassette domain-containing protein [Thermoleophilia bacterium]
MSAVELRDVFRVYSEDGAGVAALQGLTLSVQEGEICVVLGPSGSGKSTLLRLLAGLDRPSAGRVTVFGADVGRLRGRALARYRSQLLGYAEQDYRRALAEELTARELVGLQLALAGASQRERDRRADELLSRVGLADRRDARAGELSGGEQQRVAVCAALAHRPRLFLADEPTGELDRANAAVVYEVIGELAREEGATTVIVSHDPQSGAIADRIVRVRDGRVSEEVARGREGERIVVGKGGWLRLSEELLRRAGIASSAEARLAAEGIVVAAAGESRPSPPAQNGALPEPASRPHGPLVAEARGLSKRYGSGATAALALHGVNASFRAGSLYAVTGPSGSGKTTLLHLLAGLDVPSGGEVVVGGCVVSQLDRSARADLRRERIALVGQEPGLVPFLSARENVELALALRGAAGNVREALAQVGLGERAEQRVALLSAGERERVAVARALVVRPALLLADEPTARLDQANALAVSALFVRLARDSGAAVVCATHDPVVIEQADEVVALERVPTPRTAPRERARAAGADRFG